MNYKKEKSQDSNAGCFIVAIVIAFLIFGINQCSNSGWWTMHKARESNQITSYENYIKTFPDGRYIAEAEDSLCSLIKDFSIVDLSMYKDKYSGKGSVSTKLSAIIGNKVNELYDNAMRDNSIDGWEFFKTQVPIAYQRDADARILTIRQEQERKKWGTEANAWNTAKGLNTTDAYDKYMSMYPYGAHYSQANKKSIDLAVDDVFKGEHGYLPASEKTGYSSGRSYSTVEIENKTEYSLIIMYSGVDSQKLKLQPHQTSSLTMKNGHYRVTARVEAGNVMPYAGEEDLDGSQYGSSFYISTSYRNY